VKRATDQHSTLRLPPQVRAAALDVVGGSSLRDEFAWMSWAGTVWRLIGDSGAVYVKRAANLRDERDRTAWLAGRWPVPEVLGFFKAYGDDWLLTREVPGVPLYHASVGWEPARVARRLGEILRELHATDFTGCPFGDAKPGHVLIHGDYCLPNVLVDQGRLTALVDLGKSGIGDPRDDFAAALWSLHYNFGHGFARVFLDAYGVSPMADRDIERMRKRYGRPYTGKTVSTTRQQYHAATDR
jgi:aminoglycoside phosphotransferase